MAGIPAYPRSGRNHQDRPVTPEVAGSNPVAPVKFLQISMFCCLSWRKRPSASFHPAYIPHGNSRREPLRPGNSRKVLAGPHGRRSSVHEVEPEPDTAGQRHDHWLRARNRAFVLWRSANRRLEQLRATRATLSPCTDRARRRPAIATPSGRNVYITRIESPREAMTSGEAPVHLLLSSSASCSGAASTATRDHAMIERRPRKVAMRIASLSRGRRVRPWPTT